MKRPTLFYQRLNWSDFFGETTTMNGAEKGTYLLLMGNYFMNRGPLPDDDSRLALMTGLTLEQWQAIRPAMERHFEVRRGWWNHARIDRELADAIRIWHAKRQGAWTARARLQEIRAARRPVEPPPQPADLQSESESELDTKIPSSRSGFVGSGFEVPQGSIGRVTRG
jgi:uncharacterized protein YdaU (DUF1376 family)